MSTLQQNIERALSEVLALDPELAQELGAVESGPTAASTAARGLTESAEDPAPAESRDSVDKYAVARPVLDVKGDFLWAHRWNRESQVWKDRLLKWKHVLRASGAVGRIEVKGNGDLTVAGTGFLIHPGVIATNRHVAEQFAEKVGDEFVFRANLGDEEMEASIDFLEEAGVSGSLEFKVLRVLRMRAEDAPDVAFLRVAAESEGRPLPEPLEFSTDEPRPGQLVAAVGYPQRDTRDKHAEDQEFIFGKLFDKKRISPGQVRTVTEGALTHDCSVLRGNSGSPLIDVYTGKVVGIHTVGELLEKNSAVTAAAAAKILAEVVEEDDDGPPPSDPDAPAAPVASARTSAQSGELSVPSAGRSRPRPRTPAT